MTHGSPFCWTPRALLSAAVVLLFLMLQQEMQLHALTHIGSLLPPSHEQGVQAPADKAACVECALLAAGAHTLLGSAVALAPRGCVDERAPAAFLSQTVAAPSYYSSRAPPTLL